MVKYWLDAGHGGADPGAVWGGIHEADIVLNIMQHAKWVLENEYIGAQVGITRNANNTVELGKRDDLADNWGADYFVSIHDNAGGGEGFESFVYNGNIDSKTINLQNILHAEVLSTIRQFDPIAKDRGKKRANFAVLRETNMPAALLEILFIDDKEDNALLKREDFRQAIGRAIARALAKVGGLAEKPKPQQPAPTAPGETAPAGKLYKVQVGAFSKKENAEVLLKKLEAAGFKGFIDLE